MTDCRFLDCRHHLASTVLPCSFSPPCLLLDSHSVHSCCSRYVHPLSTPCSERARLPFVSPLDCTFTGRYKRKPGALTPVLPFETPLYSQSTSGGRLCSLVKYELLITSFAFHPYGPFRPVTWSPISQERPTTLTVSWNTMSGLVYSHDRQNFLPHLAPPMNIDPSTSRDRNGQAYHTPSTALAAIPQTLPAPIQPPPPTSAVHEGKRYR